MSVIKLPDTEEMLALMADLEGSEIRSGGEWKADLQDMASEGDLITGQELPWGKTQDKFLVREGEVSLIAGMNGHMKSAWCGMVGLFLAKQAKVCIMSLEMKPKVTLHRMANQAAGCTHSREWAGAFADWIDDRIYIYDQLDTIPADRILGAVYYAAKVIGCRYVFIDSLAKCGTRNDPEIEQAFIDRLGWAAKTLNVHIFLVAHVRKPQSAGEEYIPTKFDVRGAGQLTDLVDNVILWWKNKARLEALDKQERGLPLTPKELDTIELSADFLMIVAKQRHAPFEGKIPFYKHSQSMQFLGDRQDRALPFHIPMQRASHAG